MLLVKMSSTLRENMYLVRISTSIFKIPDHFDQFVCQIFQSFTLYHFTTSLTT